MTEKPAMTVEEQCDVVRQKLIEAVATGSPFSNIILNALFERDAQAYARGRRDGFKEGQVDMRKEAAAVCRRPVMLPMMPKINSVMAREIEIDSIRAYCAEHPPSLGHAQVIERLLICALVQKEPTK